MRIAVTGSNGYVGSKIVDYLRQQGEEVFELGRTASKSLKKNEQFIYFELGKPIYYKSLQGFDVLIHCAYDFKLRKPKDINQINVQGSIDLLKTAKKAGVNKILFLSTVSAFDGCKTHYGKAKLAIEKEAKKIGAIIIRPGLIYGKNYFKLGLWEGEDTQYNRS